MSSKKLQFSVFAELESTHLKASLWARMALFPIDLTLLLDLILQWSVFLRGPFRWGHGQKGLHAPLQCLPQHVTQREGHAVLWTGTSVEQHTEMWTQEVGESWWKVFCALPQTSGLWHRSWRTEAFNPKAQICMQSWHIKAFNHFLPKIIDHTDRFRCLICFSCWGFFPKIFPLFKMLCYNVLFLKINDLCCVKNVERCVKQNINLLCCHLSEKSLSTEHTMAL